MNHISLYAARPRMPPRRPLTLGGEGIESSEQGCADVHRACRAHVFDQDVFGPQDPPGGIDIPSGVAVTVTATATATATVAATATATVAATATVTAHTKLCRRSSTHVDDKKVVGEGRSQEPLEIKYRGGSGF